MDKPRVVTREETLLGSLKSILTILILVTVLENEKEWRDGFHSRLTSAWTYVWENWAGRDDWFGFVVLTNLWGTAIYWTIGLSFALLDFANFEWTKKYKMQPGTNQPVEKNKFIKCVLQVLFNQFVIGPVFAAAMMPVLRWRGANGNPDNIPGLTTFLRHLVGWAVCEEIGFYYAHRLFHEVRPLYIAIHKQHHEWIASIGIAARYAHPVEDVLANVFPVFLGPLVMGSPLVFWWIWLALALVSTVISHSGYHFPYLPSGEYHDFHHLKFDTNYGAFGFLDAVHGTDVRFRRSVNALRHRVLNSFKSAREEFPDDYPMPVVDTIADVSPAVNETEKKND